MPRRGQCACIRAAVGKRMCPDDVDPGVDLGDGGGRRTGGGAHARPAAPGRGRELLRDPAGVDVLPVSSAGCRALADHHRRIGTAANDPVGARQDPQKRGPGAQMTPTARLILFVVACVAVAGVYASAALDLGPSSDTYAGMINALTVPERHITDAVTAVNFDFRGFDTLGEEYIMFASVLGTALLLRRQRGE